LKGGHAWERERGAVSAITSKKKDEVCRKCDSEIGRGQEWGEAKKNEGGGVAFNAGLSEKKKVVYVKKFRRGSGDLEGRLCTDRKKKDLKKDRGGSVR